MKKGVQRTRTILSLSAALFLVGGWSVAADARQQVAASQNSQQKTQPGSMPNMPGMPGMNPGDNSGGHGADNKGSGMGPGAGDQTEADAVHSMEPGEMHMMGPHMRMTPPRPVNAEDWARADQIAATLRSSIEKYKDYRVAIADGYRIFLPNVPQTQYYFTNYFHGFLEGFTFDPARPTSLLYKKTRAGGYELVGAMYTAAKGATLDQLNERVPLSVASWHAHTNLCLPKSGTRGKVDWTRFGLGGSIATLQACREAGGLFYPQIFGWMVHVYPFEATREKIWGQDMGQKKLDHATAPSDSDPH